MMCNILKQGFKYTILMYRFVHFFFHVFYKYVQYIIFQTVTMCVKVGIEYFISIFTEDLHGVQR